MTILVWLILAVVWGTTWIFIKVGLGDLPPITFAAARFLLALVTCSDHSHSETSLARTAADGN